MKKKSKLTVFIDHTGNIVASDSLLYGQAQLAKTVRDRLSSIGPSLEVLTYADFVKITADAEGISEEAMITNWERITAEAVQSADIVIPIVSADYLSYISPTLETIFDNIVGSSDKYLFPIIYSYSEWSSVSWIVKSKLIQVDGKPLKDYSAERFDEVISELVRTVRDIAQIKNEINISTTLKPKLPAIPNNIIAGIDSEVGSLLLASSSTVFISHSHEDSDFAELLQLKLERENIFSWLDSEKLKIGQDWQVEIDDGIDNSIAVIAVMSPEARKSEYVTYEWAYAWGKGKKIFPVMLKQTPLHPRLESLQYLDFTNKNTRPYSILIDAIKSLIKKE